MGHLQSYLYSVEFIDYKLQVQMKQARLEITKPSCITHLLSQTLWCGYLLWSPIRAQHKQNQKRNPLLFLIPFLFLIPSLILKINSPASVVSELSS